MDYKEFAKKIKEKYPQYNDMDDLTLAKKMVAKYPTAYSDVTFEKSTTQKAIDKFSELNQKVEQARTGLGVMGSEAIRKAIPSEAITPAKTPMEGAVGTLRQMGKTAIGQPGAVSKTAQYAAEVAPQIAIPTPEEALIGVATGLTGKVLAKSVPKIAKAVVNTKRALNEGSSSIGDFVAAYKRVKGTEKLKLGKEAVKAIDDASNVMYKHYGDTYKSMVKDAIEINPNASVDVTESISNLIGKIQDNKLDITSINKLKSKVPGFKELLSQAADGNLPDKITLSLKDADEVITRLQEITPSKGSAAFELRELRRSFIDDAGEILPEFKDLKRQYATFKDDLKIAERAINIGEHGSGAAKPFSNIQKQEAVQNVIGLSEPRLIGKMQSYHQALKNLDKLKKIGYGVGIGAPIVGGAVAIAKRIGK